MTPAALPKWIDEKAVSETTGLALSTIRNARMSRTLFPFYKFGRSVRYRTDDVIAYCEAQRIETRDAEAAG